MPDASAFVHRLEVRFSDCDLLGHVNNAVYFTYFEQARVAWWRHVGGDARFPGANAVVVHAECDYRAPAFPHEVLDVCVALDGIGRSSVTMSYEIVNAASEQTIAVGKTISVTVDETSRKPIPVPDEARQLLQSGRSAGAGSIRRLDHSVK